jgi:hypothetical protein
MSVLSGLLFLSACLALRFYLDAHPAAGAGALAPAGARDAPAAAARLPYVDMVIIVTNPWRWSHRRGPVAKAFRDTRDRARASGHSARLLFVFGDTETPAVMSPEDAAIFADPDIGFVEVANCKDYDDKGWPGAWDGVMFPPVNSSTTCKVLGGAAHAVERFRFRYFARSGDDSYLRWDYFLRERAQALGEERVMMGFFNSNQGVFDHLFGVFGKGRFPNYATGQGYIMTHDVAAYLRAGYLARPQLVTAGPEDAAIALHLWPLDVANIHSTDFHDVYGRACDENTILVHYVTKEMVRFFGTRANWHSARLPPLCLSPSHARCAPPRHAPSHPVQWDSIDKEGRVYCAKQPKPKPKRPGLLLLSR